MMPPTRMPFRLALVLAMGRALGMACYTAGSVFRSPSLRALGLPSLAERSFRRGDLEGASARAGELLRIAEEQPDRWDHGNALHKAHAMLGRVALARGEPDLAAKELIASASIPGSPQLVSFGPNMQLALELLQAGRKEPVLEYLRLCGTFWQMGHPKLQAWSVDVEDGRVPAFGGNLIY